MYGDYALRERQCQNLFNIFFLWIFHLKMNSAFIVQLMSTKSKQFIIAHTIRKIADHQDLPHICIKTDFVCKKFAMGYSHT